MNAFWTFALCLILVLNTKSLTAQLPVGFDLEPVVENIGSIGGIRFVNDSTSLLWGFDGKVYVMVNGVEPINPVLDISDEVGQWGDHGMLGFAVDPLFSENGRFYLLYAVDSYHLLHSEDPDYDPDHSAPFTASIGRVTRYALDTAYPHDLVPGSRAVLIGSEIDNGIPLMTASHGVGSLEFGSDGSLLVSCGDGSTWVGAFNGGPPFPDYAFGEQGMALGFLRQDENIGSFRAQYVNSYSGKLLRIDPVTGSGLASNPFFNDEAPDAPASKVWSLGLRNPFRIVHRPGTGSSLMSEGDPGKIFIGDVGYHAWEEINVVDGPGLNFGWPIYEGAELSSDYGDLFTDHPQYLNPLPEPCPHSHYRFQDLLVQPNADHVHEWLNPCDSNVQIEDSLVRFVHEPPAVSYTNQATPHEFDVLLPGFNDEGEFQAVAIEDLLGFEEGPFTGISSIAGDFYDGTSFPEEYHGAFFQSDYSGWIKVFWFDSNDRLTNFRHLTNGVGPVLSTRFNPYDECMYFTSAGPARIERLCFGGNVDPHAVIEVDTIYGESPLTVFLDGSLSYDPDDDPITFAWDLGDGTQSTDESLSHTFIAPTDQPVPYQVSLVVTDAEGNTDESEVIISINNTPPVVRITSVADSSYYSTTQTTYVDLVADVQDAEFADGDLYYEWQVVQHHNSHVHSNPVSNTHVSYAVFEPAGCEDFATYFYSVTLTVTDEGGLSGSDRVTVLPDCISTSVDALSFMEFTLFPNPTQGQLTVHGLVDAEQLFRVRVIDLLGKVHYDKDHRVDQLQSISVQLPQLAEGLYFLSLTGERANEVIPFFYGPSE